MNGPDQGRTRSHATRWRRVVVVALATAALAAPSSARAGGAPQDVAMLDNRFDPVTATVAQGQGVEFENFGRVAHDAVDGTGLDLFATDIVAPGDPATIAPLPGAGAYRYYCTFHPEMVGRLRVPVTAGPATGPVGGRVTIRWAAARPAAGLVVDVQRRRPGADRFVAWRTDARAAAAAFRPDQAGGWSFRARVHDASGPASADWSPVRTIQVT